MTIPNELKEIIPLLLQKRKQYTQHLKSKIFSNNINTIVFINVTIYLMTVVVQGHKLMTESATDYGFDFHKLKRKNYINNT